MEKAIKHQANNNIKILISNLYIKEHEHLFQGNCPNFNNTYLNIDKSLIIYLCENKLCIECKNKYLEIYKKGLLELYVIK